MNRQEYMKFHEDACKKMIEITKAKNADYAGNGIDAFANFRQIGSLVKRPGVEEIGFLTRMSDKMSRIGSFVDKGVLMVKDESIEDTLLDLANYCILFSGFIKSQKQKGWERTEQIMNSPAPTEFKGVDYKNEYVEHQEKILNRRYEAE